MGFTLNYLNYAFDSEIAKQIEPYLETRTCSVNITKTLNSEDANETIIDGEIEGTVKKLTFTKNNLFYVTLKSTDNKSYLHISGNLGEFNTRSRFTLIKKNDDNKYYMYKILSSIYKIDEYGNKNLYFSDLEEYNDIDFSSISEKEYNSGEEFEIIDDSKELEPSSIYRNLPNTLYQLTEIVASNNSKERVLALKKK